MWNPTSRRAFGSSPATQVAEFPPKGDSMSDEVELRLAGNLRDDVRLIGQGGDVVATAHVCAARSMIVDGLLVDQTICLRIELAGRGLAHAFAAQHRKGSRVVLRGYLEERRTTRAERLPRADGGGDAAVQVERREYVMIVEYMLHVDDQQLAATYTGAAPALSLEERNARKDQTGQVLQSTPVVPAPEQANTSTASQGAHVPWEW